jgi:hypothetical protein
MLIQLVDGVQQDTPAVKFTYAARVRVPAQLTALMSAVPVGEPQQRGDTKEFSFEQKVRLSRRRGHHRNHHQLQGRPML